MAPRWRNLTVGAFWAGDAGPRAWLTSPAFVQGVAAAWFVAVVLVDLLTPPSFRTIGLLAFAPLLVSAVCPPSVTAAWAGAALVTTVASILWQPTSPATAVLRLLNISVLGGTAVLLSVVRVRRERRLAQLAAVAEAAQRAILPTLPERVAGLHVAARYHSAAEEAHVGGDVYDLVASERHVRIVVGDVCGKGLGGVAEAARLVRAFRQYAPADGDLQQLGARLDEYMSRFLDVEGFVTCVLVQIDERGVSVVSCGHPPPLLLGDHGLEELVAPAGPPIGLGVPAQALTRTWRRGQRLLLYTDGLIEARNTAGRFLPAHLIEKAMMEPDVDASLDRLTRSLQDFVPRHRLVDDVCLVLVENETATRN